MKELELKYLAPYLPYKLRVADKDSHSLITMVASIEGTEVHIANSNWSNNLNELTIGGVIEAGKLPILRPLSDLTKEIEHNGDKFVPLEAIAKTLWEREPESFNDVEGSEFWVENQVINKVKELKGYDDIIHWCYQDLIKWHFDVFGLLDHDLAKAK